VAPSDERASSRKVESSEKRRVLRDRSSAVAVRSVRLSRDLLRRCFVSNAGLPCIVADVPQLRAFLWLLSSHLFPSSRNRRKFRKNEQQPKMNCKFHNLRLTTPSAPRKGCPRTLETITQQRFQTKAGWYREHAQIDLPLSPGPALAGDFALGPYPVSTRPGRLVSLFFAGFLASHPPWLILTISLAMLTNDEMCMSRQSSRSGCASRSGRMFI
jgi:hypothetical protein